MAQRAHVELIKKWAEDESIEIECSSNNGVTWFTTDGPTWLPSLLYRIKATKPSIDWNHVAPEYKWLAVDIDGAAYVYKTLPETNIRWGAWEEVGEDEGCSSVKAFTSYKAGTCDWKDSLLERPEGV